MSDPGKHRPHFYAHYANRVRGERPPEEMTSVAAVLKVLDDPEAGPVLLHCSTSNRAGGVWAAIQARRGKSLEEALEEALEEGKKAASRATQ